MRITYGQETDPDLIRAAEQAYREAQPLERGEFDRGAKRRNEVVQRHQRQQDEHAA